jgi:hypothetical protein
MFKQLTLEVTLDKNCKHARARRDKPPDVCTCQDYTKRYTLNRPFLLLGACKCQSSRDKPGICMWLKEWNSMEHALDADWRNAPLP